MSYRELLQRCSARRRTGGWHVSTSKIGVYGRLWLESFLALLRMTSFCYYRAVLQIIVTVEVRIELLPTIGSVALACCGERKADSVSELLRGHEVSTTSR
jgi:hypothetical protein